MCFEYTGYSNLSRLELEKRLRRLENRKTYFDAMDDVMNYINTLDEQDPERLRSLIYGFCLRACPTR